MAVNNPLSPMKNAIKLTAFAAALAISSSILAGSAVYDTSKTVTQPVATDTCPCFAPGLSWGIYGGGFLPRDRHNSYDDAFGGGLLVEYFFTENIGIQASYGAFATNGTEHLFNGDLVLRAPIHSICLAPYLIAGGGGDVDGEKLGEWHAGAGLDLRFESLHCMGLFADGTYNWHSSRNRDRDYAIVRLGLKFKL
jgi:hypothetical protein